MFAGLWIENLSSRRSLATPFKAPQAAPTETQRSELDKKESIRAVVALQSAARMRVARRTYRQQLGGAAAMQGAVETGGLVRRLLLRQQGLESALSETRREAAAQRQLDKGEIACVQQREASAALASEERLAQLGAAHASALREIAMREEGEAEAARALAGAETSALGFALSRIRAAREADFAQFRMLRGTLRALEEEQACVVNMLASEERLAQIEAAYASALQGMATGEEEEAEAARRAWQAGVSYEPAPAGARLPEKWERRVSEHSEVGADGGELERAALRSLHLISLLPDQPGRARLCGSPEPGAAVEHCQYTEAASKVGGVSLLSPLSL